jgi:hypothetical protein
VVAYCAWWDRRGHDATCCGACPRAALPCSAASARIAPHRRTAPDWGQSADGLVEVPEAAFDIRLGSFRRDVGVGGRDEPDAHPPPPPPRTGRRSCSCCANSSRRRSQVRCAMRRTSCGGTGVGEGGAPVLISPLSDRRTHIKIEG